MIWAYVESFGKRPEQVAGSPWKVYSYVNSAYVAQEAVTIHSADCVVVQLQCALRVSLARTRKSAEERARRDVERARKDEERARQEPRQLTGGATGTDRETAEGVAITDNGMASFMGDPGGAEDDVMAVLEGIISLLEREAENGGLDTEVWQGSRASREPRAQGRTPLEDGVIAVVDALVSMLEAHEAAAQVVSVVVCEF